MSDFIVRFLIGGTVVSLFATLGDILRPKSFAGLFGAAPSIALATIGLPIAKNGPQYAAIEARSMILGAAAFFLYTVCVSWLILRHKPGDPCRNCRPDTGLVRHVVCTLVLAHEVILT
jgi:hypothetical protein